MTGTPRLSDQHTVQYSEQSSTSMKWVTLLLIISSLGVRLPYINRGLWVDEAWVANAVLAGSPRQWFFYDAWVQSTPPLFIVLSRATVTLFGPSNFAFRLLPVAFSVVAVVLFVFFARKMFGRTLSLLCATVFAFAPGFCLYSQELKQYSADVALTVALLLLLWNHSEDEHPRSRNYWLIVACFVVAPFLSYTSIMLLPLALLVIVHVDRIWRTILFGFASTSAFALCYFIFIKPNSTDALHSFFRMNFPMSISAFGLASFYFRRLSDVMQTIVPEGLERSALVVFAGSVVVSVVGALWPVRDSRRLRILAFALIPVLTLLGANAVGKYPLGVSRLNLFLLPSLVMVPALAIEVIYDLARKRLARSGRRDLRPVGTLVTAAAILCATAVLGYKMTHRSLSNWEDVESAVNYVWSSAGPNDTIYVHSTVAESVKLYASLRGAPVARLVFGDTGWPCCPRNKDYSLTNSDLNYFEKDIDAKLPVQDGGATWELATARPAHWRDVRRNEPELILQRMTQRGCTATMNSRFHNVVVGRFNCR